MSGYMTDEMAERAREFLALVAPQVHPAVVAVCRRVVWGK